MAKQFKAKLELDSEDLIQELEKVDREFNKINQDTRRLGNQGSQSLRSTRNAARSAAGGVQNLSEQASNATNQFGQAAGAIGNVGAVVGQMNPKLNTAAGVMGQVGTAASAAAGSFGPLGVIIAGVTAVVGAAGIAYQQHREDLEAIANAAKEAADQESRLLAALQETAREQRLTQGLLSSQETQNELENTQLLIQGTTDALDANRQSAARARQELQNLVPDVDEAIRLFNSVSGGEDITGTTGLFDVNVAEAIRNFVQAENSVNERRRALRQLRSREAQLATATDISRTRELQEEAGREAVAAAEQNAREMAQARAQATRAAHQAAPLMAAVPCPQR